MQKANSPHTATRKHLSPKLSGKSSTTICQLENDLLFICSREHLFSWQAGIGQRQQTGTLVVSRAVSSAGDVKGTQKFCFMQHGTVWLCPYDWLEKASPGSWSPWPWCTPEEGGCHAGLRPQRVPGASGAAGGLPCRRYAVAETLSDQVQELWVEKNRLNSNRKNEEVATGRMERWQQNLQSDIAELHSATKEWQRPSRRRWTLPRCWKLVTTCIRRKGPSVPLDLNLQNECNVLIAKEWEQIPWEEFKASWAWITH